MEKGCRKVSGTLTDNPISFILGDVDLCCGVALTADIKAVGRIFDANALEVVILDWRILLAFNFAYSGGVIYLNLHFCEVGCNLV